LKRDARNELIEKWNIEEDGNCRDGQPRLKTMNKNKSMDEK
jgi:hypothetical protein